MVNFEQFWKHNMRRYLNLAESNIVSALQIAAEEAWEMALSDMVPEIERRRLADRLKGQVKACEKCGKEKKIIYYCEDCDDRN